MEIPRLFSGRSSGDRGSHNRWSGFRASGVIAVLFCVLAWLAVANPAAAQTAIERVQFSSPENKALYAKLTNEFRCLKCQNQNLSLIHI